MSDPGRPTLYRRDHCELARNYCLLGATNPELAEFLGVSARTIDNWIAAHPAFAAAVCEGRVVADARVARCLYERAVGYEQTVERTVLHQGREHTLTNTVHHPPDTRACIFWLRNRRRESWGDRPGRGPGGDSGGDGEELIAVLDAAGERATSGRLGSATSALPTRVSARPSSPQAARFLRASPMPSQLEPMKIRSMPRKMPSV
jgi:hypothetical protein